MDIDCFVIFNRDLFLKDKFKRIGLKTVPTKIILILGDKVLRIFLKSPFEKLPSTFDT